MGNRGDELCATGVDMDLESLWEIYAGLVPNSNLFYFQTILNQCFPNQSRSNALGSFQDSGGHDQEMGGGGFELQVVFFTFQSKLDGAKIGCC
jgi:hypothetical protein